MQDKTSLTKFYLSPAVAAGLPVLWTVSAAVLAGLIAASLAWSLFGWDPRRSAAAAAALTAGVVYAVSWSWWANKLAELSGRSLPVTASRIEIYLDERSKILPSTVSVTPQELHKIATRVVNGVSFSGRQMAGIMSPERFYTFQGELVEAKLAEPRSISNHKDGVKLTPLCWDTFQAIAALPLPKPDTEDGLAVYRLFTQATQGGSHE